VTTRIEIGVLPGVLDPRGDKVQRRAEEVLGLRLESVRAVQVYKFDALLDEEEAGRIVDELTDPVIETGRVGRLDPGPFKWAVTVGFKPGVTDNVGRTAAVAAGDILGRSFDAEGAVFTETVWYLSGAGLTRTDVERLAFGLLANEVIQRVRLESHDEWRASPIDLNVPRVESTGAIEAADIDLSGDDAELLRISSEGILSLSLVEMKAIRDHFRRAADDPARQALDLGAEPTDAELEALAQTWSEHCKHKIFNATIRYREPGRPDEVIHSLFDTCIRAATDEIGRRSGRLVSVFHDNAGVVRFNDRLDLVFKVETHNSPSALDPYGGAITGIVGVNRDPFGTGRGSALMANVWGYCLGSPFHNKALPDGLLHPRRIRDGVHQGVIDGGNQSGIPYMRGFEWFDERYVGKPLVFCGTLGVLPRQVLGAPAHEKILAPGYRIAMVGGRIGKDGIHGATFSSEELRKESPVQAVQIGDAFTQKKMTDFLLEARDLGLYTAITDNGAGGLSSSVGEMAQSTGGCEIDLELAPVKYAGLQPWEILLSEAQERMTVAIPPGRADAFLAIAAKRDVEATVLGSFTDSGMFHVRYGPRTVAYIAMDFLHDGCPTLELEAEWTEPAAEEPQGIVLRDPTADLLSLLGRLNICSKEEKARQYDHEVKGLSVVKPFVGRRRDVPADAAVMMVEHGGREGVVMSEGINPRFSDLDTYWMAASVIDLAVRRVVAAGGDPQTIAGLDNFCWPDPVQSDKTADGRFKLAQLVRANKGLADFTRAYGVPCVSGKDSMKNDSVRGGVKISIPPTLLFSAVGKIDDVSRAVTPDLKVTGDVLYVLGTTRAELGGSEYLAHIGDAERGRGYLGATGSVPRVDARESLPLYAALHAAINEELVRSAHTPSLGGLGVALALAALGGELGCTVDLDRVPAPEGIEPWELLFSESNARFVVSLAPASCARFEEIMAGVSYARVGEVIAEPKLTLRHRGRDLVDLPLERLRTAWKAPLRSAGELASIAVSPGQIAPAGTSAGESHDPNASPVKALVITGYGLNCEAETAYALRTAGADVDCLHLNDLLHGRASLADYELLALIGGFSFGDHLGAGKVYANRLKYQLAGALQEFIAAGKLIFGICNGFQTLVKMGLLPGLPPSGLNGEGAARQAPRHAQLAQQVTLTMNESGLFRDDWVWVRAEKDSPCVFTRGLDTLELPIRHGEGRFFLRDEQLLSQMEAGGLIALRYIDPATGAVATTLPANPNGSMGGVAGVCDPSGRVFGLMPHPEAFLSPFNHPQWPLHKIAGALPREGQGLVIFRNAVSYLHERRGRNGGSLS